MDQPNESDNEILERMWIEGQKLKDDIRVALADCDELNAYYTRRELMAKRWCNRFSEITDENNKNGSGGQTDGPRQPLADEHMQR